MTQPLLLPLPTRPALGLEYARCFLAGEEIGLEMRERCQGCEKLLDLEQHARRWLCRECHVTAHGGGR